MGRVYNALAKADRLTDGQRPIGRPASGDAAKGRRGDAAMSAAAEPVRREPPSAPAVSFGDENHALPSQAVSGAEAFDFDYLFALSETTGARRVAEPALPPTQESLTPSPRPHVAASSIDRVAAPAVFDEPRQIVNLKSLMVAPHVAALAGGDALAAERYRTLAVRISTLAARRKIKSLVVTSADSGEGKSTVATSLAWTLARPGLRRVLLLEASARTASTNHLFGVQPARGWLSLVDAPAELANAMLRINPNGLYVMTARGTTETADTDDGALDEALMSSRFEKLLAEFATRFDLIVIDAPAICDSAEAQQIAAIADATVIVARADRTHHRRVSEATDLVPQERRLGVVLNACEITAEVSRGGGKRSFIGRLFRR